MKSAAILTMRKKNLAQRVSAIVAAGLVAGGLGSTTCMGSVVIASPFSGGTVGIVDSATYGFAFLVGDDPITVTKLGIWEFSGLNEAHWVGLWEADGNPLAQVLIDDTDPTTEFVDEFRYKAITSVPLSANTVYVLGAHYGNPTLDKSGFVMTTFSMGSPAVTYVEARTGGDEFNIAFPDFSLSPDADFGIFGPNAQFTVVPEPQAYAGVVALGLLGFGFWRRNRRQTA